jgi:hypothetical protein
VGIVTFLGENTGATNEGRFPQCLAICTLLFND